MLSRNQGRSSINSSPTTPLSGRAESIEVPGCTCTILGLKRAIRRVFGRFTKSRDREVTIALDVVQRGTTSNNSVDTLLRQAQTTFFTQNIAVPTLSLALPYPGSRFESTAQLSLCSDLLRRHLAMTASTATVATPLDHVQQALVQSFVQNEEQSHVFGLVRMVVEEFVAAAPKSADFISEVVLLGPGLDRDDYRRLLDTLIADFEGAILLNIEPLRGLVQMVEYARPGCLIANDLVRVLAVLRTCLNDTHQQSTEHLYYLVLTVSRLLDVMVEGKVKDLRRVTEHEPLYTLLTQLSGNSDLRLKHQATYALQGLLHIPNDETRLKSILRHAGNIVMGLLGIANICRLDMRSVGEGAGQLARRL
ncbi:MAG: hypothetical protein J3R72DRAFT_473021 [Linnemannia gamsii]|nr:MAG: hypothetical protein J3R72DRAFT_473021 [Linnemannia gamsii]